jgi:hypothetical protein
MPYTPLVRRRPFVLALALLSVSLTGGTCEFRAVSNNSIPSDPGDNEPGEPETGLVLVARTGALTATAEENPTLDQATIESALATSVLSIPTFDTTTSPESSTQDPLPNQPLALVAVEPNAVRAVNAIPEPGGFWLYGLGWILLVCLNSVRRLSPKWSRERREAG